MRLAIRHALGRFLGLPLTPQAAAAIEEAILGEGAAPTGDGITTDAWQVLAFIRRFYTLGAGEFMRGLGLVRGGEMVAAVLFKDLAGGSVWMHVAAQPGKRWMTREYLFATFAYPFEQLGCNQVLGWVEANNDSARRFNEHLGFTQLHVLPGAGRDGVDVIVYRMLKEECRYVR